MTDVRASPTGDAVQRVHEGAVELLLPKRELADAGPAARAPAFYNPAMATSRDLSVLVHRALAAACPRVLDGLAGAGARGLRIAAESGVASVVLNDADPVAVAHCKRNVAVNGLSGVATARQGDLADLLADAVAPFDAVDVDPYGTVAPWVRPALAHLGPGGVLAVSSTDTAVLHGLYPDALERRYGAAMVRQAAEKEVGLRVLLGFIGRCAADLGQGVEVLLSLQTGHHVRAWLRVTGAADAVAGRVGFAHRCPACGEVWLEGPDGGDAARAGRGEIEVDAGPRACACGAATDASGPLWTGPLADRSLLDALDVGLGSLATPRRTAKLVGRLRDEVDAPPLFYDLHAMGRRLGASVPSFDDLQQALADQGRTFCRTHLVETGFRTDASRADVAELVRALDHG